MAALLLWEAAGGPRRGSAGRVPPRFDLQARSRDFLRRGLVLSGAVHLALVFAFLNLNGGGEDVALRSYSRAMDVFRDPRPELIPLPPADTGAPPGPPDAGVIDPVPMPPPEIAKSFEGFGAVDLPGETGRPGRDQPGPGSAGPANPSPAERIYFVGEVEVAPVPVEAPKPPYPGIAKEMEITGRVVARVLVRADGTVGPVVITSGNKILAESVQETLPRWRFRPAKIGDRPVDVWVEIPVVFTL